MWKILKTEYSYNKTFLLVLTVVALFFTLYEMIESSDLTGPCLLNTLIVFTMISHIDILMNKEKRIQGFGDSEEFLNSSIYDSLVRTFEFRIKFEKLLTQ